MSRTGQDSRPGLSDRQRAMLALLATGLTSAEVAEALRVSRAEVRAEISAAIGILGARSKLEAVIIALRVGFIQAPLGPRSMPAWGDAADGETGGSHAGAPDGLSDSEASASA